MSGLYQRVRDFDGKLTDVEQDVVAAIVEAAGDAAFLSAAEIARRASVHETTVTRLARKLGYDGYRELRADARAPREDGMSVRARSRGDVGQLLSGYLRDEAEALLRASDLMQQEQLDEIADLVIGARRVYVAGNETLMVRLVEILWRFGIDARALSDSDRTMSSRLIGVNDQDVIFACGVRPLDPALALLVQSAEQRGAKVVILADTPGQSLALDPVVHVTALRGADDAFRTLVVPIAFCYALEVTIYSRHTGIAETSLSELDDIEDMLRTRFT